MRKRAWICTCSLCSSVELEILFQNGRSAFFPVKNRTYTTGNWLKLSKRLNRKTPREQLSGEWKSSRNSARKENLKKVSPTALSKILRKFFAEGKTDKGQALTPSALTGIRAAIHHHLICAPLSRNNNILQDSEFMSANQMFEAKAKLFTKENNANQNTNRLFSKETCRNWIDTSWKGRTRKAFGKMRGTKFSLLRKLNETYL